MLPTDASKRGIGAVLTHVNEFSEEHPIAYYTESYCQEKRSTILWKNNFFPIKLGVNTFRVNLLTQVDDFSQEHPIAYYTESYCQEKRSTILWKNNFCQLSWD